MPPPSLSDGGCDFPAEPCLSAIEQPIFWTLETDAGAILLQPAPVSLEGFHLTVEDLHEHQTGSRDDRHLHVEIRGERFDTSLSETAYAGPLGALVFFDDDTPDRLATVARLWAAARGRRIPPDQRLTLQRRHRARQMLRVVDARADGATYRTIAQFIYPEYETDAASWVGSAIRETTIRLVRDGMKLVRGGYRAMLRRPRRRR